MPNNSYQDLLSQNVVSFNGTIYRRKPRIYSTQVVRSATAGQSFQATINLDPGLPFILNKLHADDTADTDGDNAMQSLEDWSIQVQDTESQYFWSNGAVGRCQLFGGREFGWCLPIEVLLRAQTQVNFTLTNRTTSVVAGTATLCLIGFSLLPMTQGNV